MIILSVLCGGALWALSAQVGKEWKNETRYDLQVDGNTTLVGNTISGNLTTNWGGGLSMTGRDTLNENIIFGNTAHSGGGVHVGGYNAVALSGNMVSGNTATQEGGGVFVENSSITLSGNTIISNTAYSKGGGVSLWASSPTLVNNVVVDNQSYALGSGLWSEFSSPRLLHTTVARNTGGDGCGLSVGDATLVNTIIVSQTVGIQAGGTVVMEATLWGSGAWANETDWSVFGTIVTGTVNYWGDPNFVDPDDGDYHIGPGSAAVDAGVHPGVTPVVDDDIDGDERPFDGDHDSVAKFDIGADELAVTLSIGKVGPIEALPGEFITYTLTITNSGVLSATGTVITDALPTGAHYVSGGTLMPGDVISWTVSDLLPKDDMQVQFVVTATQTIVNSDYRVSCIEGVSATGTKMVVTTIEQFIYLPLVLRNYP